MEEMKPKAGTLMQVVCCLIDKINRNICNKNFKNSKINEKIKNVVFSRRLHISELTQNNGFRMSVGDEQNFKAIFTYSNFCHMPASASFIWMGKTLFLQQIC